MAALLLLLCAVHMLPSLIIKEQTNIDYFARRDFEFMEIYLKGENVSPIKTTKLGWTVDVYQSSVSDVVNKGIEPGIRTVTNNSIYWKFTDAFYINITFLFIYQMGALPLSGTGNIKLHCSNATYTMYLINVKIVPKICNSSIM